MDLRGIRESLIEQAALAWLQRVGWQIARGPEIGLEAFAAERTNYTDVVLPGRLRSALTTMNPQLPTGPLEDAQVALSRPPGATIESQNRNLPTILGHEAHGFREVFPEGRIHRPNPYPLR